MICSSLSTKVMSVVDILVQCILGTAWKLKCNYMSLIIRLLAWMAKTLSCKNNSSDGQRSSEQRH